MASLVVIARPDHFMDKLSTEGEHYYEFWRIQVTIETPYGKVREFIPSRDLELEE